MAITFKKETILEAVKQVLAEGSKTVIVGDPATTAADIQKDTDIDTTVKQSAIDTAKKAKKGEKIEVPTKSMEEDHHENPSDESDMAKVQLYATAKYAIELLRMIQDGEQLDAWVQAKITKAADYIDAVKHYLEGEEYLAGTEAPGMEDEPVEEPIEEPVDEKMDPVGEEDDDINNDGKVDKTDKYLKNRRVKIGKAIAQHKK